mmetsp:Transcript_24991/g.83433  ORF Transcript_24991/g.83433 Transcript_24991/m.83433 type:complete len:579 (-) Transcript_24991:284-2020(-)
MAAMGDGGNTAAEASKKRIDLAGPRWWHVLDVAMSASADDIKAAYRSLVLMHHPDKGGDTDTFKKVKVAYEQGVAKCAKASKSSPKKKPKAKGKPKARPEPKRRAQPESAPPEAGGCGAAGGSARKKLRPKPVPLTATKAKLRAAIQKWENSCDPASKTMPDDIPALRPRDVAVLLQLQACVLVDTREDHECDGSRIPGSSHLSFAQLVTEPELCIQDVTQLFEDGRKLVLISGKGERMGRCGLLGTVLLDVFGFDEAKVACMDEGVLGWQKCVASDPALRAQEALAKALDAKGAVDAKLKTAKAELAPWRTAMDSHLKVLVDGAWVSEVDVGTHVDGLSDIFTSLECEESLRSMLAVAARKRPSARGAFDNLAFTELSERFEAMFGGLQQAHDSVAATVAALSADVEAARNVLDEVRQGKAAADEQDGGESSRGQTANPGLDGTPAQSGINEGDDTKPRDAQDGTSGAGQDADVDAKQDDDAEEAEEEEAADEDAEAEEEGEGEDQKAEKAGTDDAAEDEEEGEPTGDQEDGEEDDKDAEAEAEAEDEEDVDMAVAGDAGDDAAAQDKEAPAKDADP